MERKDARDSSPGLHRRETGKTTARKCGKSTAASGPAVRRSASKRSTRPMLVCWLTGKRGRKYYAQHHVFTVEEVPDLTVWLCRGAHYLVNLLSRYKTIIDDPEKWEDLIMLARAQANLPNKRIKVIFEEVN